MKKEIYTFTFGANQPNAGGCVQIKASSFTRARDEMTRLHGDFWSSGYDEATWKKIVELTRKNGIRPEQPICQTIELEDDILETVAKFNEELLADEKGEMK